MIQDGLLCAKRLAEVLLKLSNMKNTLEFEIPDGYELDKDNSTAKKAVYKKVDKYEPKEGDLVYSRYGNAILISIYGYDGLNSISKVLGSAVGWFTMKNMVPYGSFMRPATSAEASLFLRILSENGYEYDPEKKEVRKKASHIYYIDENMEVCKTANNGCYASTLRMVGNSFRTREEAEEVAAEFRKILNNKKA